MKKILTLISVLFAIVILAGCGGSGGGSDPTPDPITPALVKDNQAVTIINEDGTEKTEILNTFVCTNNAKYQVIFNNPVSKGETSVEPAYVQNLESGAIYFAEVYEEGQGYRLITPENKLALAFPDFPEEYLGRVFGNTQMPYVNLIVDSSNMASEKVKIGNENVYPITHTFKALDDETIIQKEVRYWSAKQGWFIKSETLVEN